VLGSHPHVLHPVTQTIMKDIDGKVRNRVAASSLGNFVSSKLTKSENTIRGMILSLTLTKSESGVIDVLKIDKIPTIVEKRKADKTAFTVMPV
ncbi:CapA family protein, partial [Paenibacillus sp. TAF58]